MRGKGEGSIFKDSRGLWTATIELPARDGIRRRKTVRSKDKRTVVMKLAALRREYEIHGDLHTDTTTVEQWFTIWLETYVSPTVRPKTAESYRSVVRRQIIPSLGGNTRLEKITAASVRRLRTDIAAAGLSSTYARNAHHVLARALSDAVREGRIPANPVELVDPPRKQTVELDVLTLPDALRMLEHIASRPDGARWAFSLLTGARRGEALGLERDRVGDVLDLSWQLQRLGRVDGQTLVPADFEHRHLTGGLYLTRPKSRAGWRVIPLVEPLRSILRQHLAATPPGEHGLVFTDHRGQPRDPDYDTKAWKAVLGTAFPGRAVRLHDLRHTAVDLLYLAGVPEDLITEIVGHSTRTMTRAYKARGNLDRLTGAMEQMGALFSSPTRMLGTGES